MLCVNWPGKGRKYPGTLYGKVLKGTRTKNRWKALMNQGQKHNSLLQQAAPA